MSQPVKSRLVIIGKRLLPLIIIALAILVFMALKKTKPVIPAEPTVEKVWKVKVIKANPASFKPGTVLYGKTEAPDSLNLLAPVTAYVDSVKVKEGMSVTANQAIVELDSREEKLLLVQREADVAAIKSQLDTLAVQHRSNQSAFKVEKRQLDLSAKTLARYKNLRKRKAISEDKVDKVQNAYNQQALLLNQRQQAIQAFPSQKAQLEAQLAKMQALMDSAQLKLERMTLSAPFDARISSIQATAGERVNQGTTLASLYNPKTQQVRTQLPSRLIEKVRKSLDEKLHLSAYTTLGSQRFDLVLSRLASKASSNASGLDALFEFKAAQTYPEPGRTLEIHLELPAEDQLIALPTSALYGSDQIYRVADGILQNIKVERIGNHYEAKGAAGILIRSDQLSAGDLIVSTQLPNAISGLAVQVVE